jgi:hypothetical protein
VSAFTCTNRPTCLLEACADVRRAHEWRKQVAGNAQHRLCCSGGYSRRVLLWRYSCGRSGCVAARNGAGRPGATSASKLRRDLTKRSISQVPLVRCAYQTPGSLPARRLTFESFASNSQTRGPGCPTHPGPLFEPILDSETAKGESKLAMIIYNIESDRVDPIFYPVVPDSFMRRGQERTAAPTSHLWSADWPEQIDRPLSSPGDRWSF